jgi:choline-sulfatase
LHGFEERLTTDIYPADFGWTPDWESPGRRPSWYHNMLSVVQAGTCLTSNQLDYDEEVAFRAVRKLHDMARSTEQRPFCLFVSFTHPHDPFAILAEYWDRYDHSQIDMPAVPPIRVDQQDPHSQRLHHVCDFGRYAQTEERVRSARHAYYGSISYIDDKVGLLLRTLEDAQLADDTVVVFTSDHGEMLGERGLWYKMTFFEWAVRVPLIVYNPRGMATHRVTQHVSLMDLVPTLVELAAEGGWEPPGADHMDGRSLVPLLRGSASGWPNEAIAEILCEGAIAPCLMVRRDDYKYIYSEPDPDQLYYLPDDPHELVNVATHPDYEPVRRRFEEQVHERWRPAQLRKRVVASQNRRRLVARAMQVGKKTSWDFQPHWDASEQYIRSHMDLDSLERRARYPIPDVPAPDADSSG